MLDEESVDLIKGFTKATFLFFIISLVVRRILFDFVNEYFLCFKSRVSRINAFNGGGDNGQNTSSCVGEIAKSSAGPIPSAKVTRLSVLISLLNKISQDQSTKLLYKLTKKNYTSYMRYLGNTKLFHDNIRVRLVLTFL